MAWTEECIASMKLLFGDGLSASQIAEKLNRDFNALFSRNAVIGKLHRCGLRRAEGSILLRKPRPKREGPKRHYKKRAVRWTPQTGIEPVKPPDTEIEIAMTHADEDIPLKQRKSLWQLTEATCRWPVGDPGTEGFFFCGAESVQGMPYCVAHLRRAYQPGSVGRARAWVARRSEAA